MADEAPLPDSQLESILEVLRQLLAISTADQGAGGGDPQLANIWSVLDDICGVVVDIFNAMGKAGTNSGPTGSPSDPLPIPDAPQDSPQLASILEELKRLYDVQTAVTATVVEEPGEEKGGGGIGALLAVLSEFKYAILAVVGIVLGAVAAVTNFVQALDPGLIEAYGRAFKDLQATLGIAFTGVFEQGMNLFRGIAAAVQPIFAALKPIVDQLVNAAMKTFESALIGMVPILEALLPILGIVVQLFSLVGAVLRPLSAMFSLLTQVVLAPLTVILSLLMAVLDPLVRVVAAVMDGFTDLINTFSVIFRVLIESITAFIATLFGGSLQETVKQIADAFKELIKAVIMTAAKLAMMLGATDFVKRLRDAFNQTGENAVGSTSIKGLEQIGKDLATASVNAAGAESAKDATNADIVKSLDALLANNDKNTNSIVTAILKRELGEAGGSAATEVVKLAISPVGYAAEKAVDALNYLGLNPF